MTTSDVLETAMEPGWRNGLLGKLRSIPLFYKVLLPNVAIVVFGAVAGTYVTATTSRDDQLPSRIELMLFFAAIGVLLSVAVNYFVLRAAFEPIDSLGNLAVAVRNGDLSARALPAPMSDPQMFRLVDTFNRTLDELEANQTRLRELATQVIQAQEGERQRIARELHDDTAQILFAQLLSVTALKSSPHEDVRTTAAKLEEFTVETIEGVRRLALELRPPALDDLGVREAIGDLAQRYTEKFQLEITYVPVGIRERLIPEVELVLYRVAQEALTNVVKHANAHHVVITFERTLNAVDLSVEDDGTGFSPAATRVRDEAGLGFGLFGMEERANLVGGHLDIEDLPEGGTRIRLSIPISTDGSPLQKPVTTAMVMNQWT